MDKQIKFTAAATGILVVAAVLRLVWLQDMPPGLVRDETLNADIASFILQGRHALFFREGFGHEPLYHYLGAIFQFLIGDNFLAIRTLPAFLGLILVAATMRWVKRDFGPQAGLLTGALLAVSWWSIIFSRVGLRPVLEPVLLVGVAWFWQRKPWFAGLLLGLSVYSYTAARVVLLIPPLYLLYLFLFRNKLSIKKPDYKGTLIIMAVSLGLYLPLALTLRSDPSLQERLGQLSGPLDALQAGDIVPILRGTLATLGVFAFKGDPLWSYSLPGWPLFGPLTAVIFGVGLAFVLWRTGKKPVYGLVLIWFGVTMIPSLASAEAPSLIRLIGAMPVVYLFPALALAAIGNWINSRPVNSPSWLITLKKLFPVFIVLLLLFNLGRTLRGGFVEWAAAEPVRQKYQSIWLDISRYWRDNGGNDLVVADSWYEPVKADSLRRDLGQLVPARWVQQGSAVVFPAGENALLFIPEFAPLHPELASFAGFGEPDYRSPAFPSFAAYTFIEEPEFSSTQQPVLFTLTGGSDPLISMLGLEFLEDSQDGQLVFITGWRVETPLPWDLSIFSHLKDENDTLVGQHDGLDAAPTTLSPGDIFFQIHSIEMPPDGTQIQLQVGLYTRQDGHRLARPDGSGDHRSFPIPEGAS